MIKSDTPADTPPTGPPSDALPPEDNAALRDLARKYGIDFLSRVSDDMLDPGLVSDLSVEWARSNCLLPIILNGKKCVLTADPGQVSHQEYLSVLLEEELSPVLAPREVILQGIERCYYSKDDSPSDFLRDIGVEESTESREQAKTDDLLQVAEKAPVTQFVNLILLAAVKRRASDIHFEPFESSLRVRYRIDGVLYETASPPKHLEEALVSRLKVMARMDIAEKRLPQDGMASVRVGEREIDIRVSTVPVAEGERVVLRLLDRKSVLLPLESLGMSDVTLQAFQSLLGDPNGMIVVCGPTGSGKTTTLYAALGQMDTSRKNVMTIEEPIEYQLPDIGQIQVKPKIGLTFASGLRHILRQDPDIVLVGETRDLETAEIAIRAALTGHLVFTTLHTNDAPGAILRLVDMGVERYLLAACLGGILAQRLVRRLCAKCKMQATLGKDDVSILGRHGKGLEGSAVWEAKGCPACLEGYTGRVGLFELMMLGGEMQELVRSEHADANAVRKLAEARGMVSLVGDGVRKVLGGLTSLSEFLDVTGPSVARDENL